MGPQLDPIASWHLPAEVRVGPAPHAEITGVPVASTGEPPARLGLTREQLAGLGFHGARGQLLALYDRDGKALMAYGTGDPASLDDEAARQAAGALARAAAVENLAIEPPSPETVQATVEGALLARYRPGLLQNEPPGTPLVELSVVVDADPAVEAAERGAALARATALARDLANSPPSMLTAERFAAVAEDLAAECGWRVEVFDRAALTEMGCGGLLGVNAGSVDEPRMIKIRYRPRNEIPRPAHLALVGKGIMYDSGGIALKPADAVHATMKNDMSGAGAIMAAMAVLKTLGCPTAVTAYLMCTDNMPSGSATKLGDVLTIRGGTTVEVVNTDAEGRLVMADALVLAGEEPVDAIVDMATLTGACLRALGARIAGVFGNDQSLVDQVLGAASASGEPAWQLPLAREYRGELDSDTADIKNMGGPNAAAIHAALFLDEFTGGRPWAHVDIAGTAQTDTAGSWRTPGCTGFGARLLAELACGFTPPRTEVSP